MAWGVKFPKRKCSFITPFWGNRNFTPGTNDLDFKLWADRGICKVPDLYDNDILLSFNEMKQKFDIDSKYFFSNFFR